jgi:hypothetical protein
MPVSLQSRYAGLATFEAAGADQKRRPTVAIRPPTPPLPGAPLYRHLVTGAETIEYLAWRYYGASEQWWRIAEANPLAFPLDVESATYLSIPGSGDVGRVERTRNF